MSLIFKALQRFGSPEVEQGRDPQTVNSKRNATTLRKVLVSPPVALSAATAIFVVGLIVSQGIRWIPSKMTSATTMAIAAAPEEGASQDPLINDTETMTPPGMEGISPDLLNADPTEQVSFHVYPPEAEKTVAVNGAANPDKVQFRYLESGDTKKAEGGDSPNKTIEPTKTAALDSKNNVVGASTSPGKHAAPRRSGNDHRPRELSLVRYDTITPSVEKASESGTAKPMSSVPSPPPLSADRNPAHKRQSEQATLHLEVSRLAQRISSAIQSDKHQQAATLLAKLAKIKGTDNDFVLKLKAYSLIRQNRLDDARTLLSEVLAHDATDREAGLNMAVVDMKTGRLDDARRRLVQLQELYPEDSHIPIYLRQLPH